MTFRLLAFVLLATACRAAEPAAKASSPVDQISQDAIQSAFQILRRDYIRREDLTLDQLNRAALLGVLTRLDFGAELVRANGQPTATSGRVVAELLTPYIAYLRPIALVPAEVGMMEKALADFASKEARHLILDLRSLAIPGDLETAASMAELFLPRGELLFKLRQLGGGDAQLLLSNREPVWTRSVLVLVDAQSSNVAETLAAVLQQKKRALLVGDTTRGATVRYEEVPLDQGWHLRFARAEVLLADDTSVFKTGVKPEFPVPLDPKIKHAVFQSSTTHSIKEHIFEQPRERYNERALVSGKNPELDDYIQRSSGVTLSYDKPPPRDRVLQRAVDLLIAESLNTAPVGQ